MTRYFDGDTFERNGHTFRVAFPYDDDVSDAPWERSDGHGPVSDWEWRKKRPHERILCSDRGSHRFYDWREACKLARRDGWNAPPYDAPNRIARAVESDFQFLRAWCNDEWQYLGVKVDRIDASGAVVDSRSVWGIESTATDYLAETAHELADEMLHEVREAQHWAERDVITLR